MVLVQLSLWYRLEQFFEIELTQVHYNEQVGELLQVHLQVLVFLLGWAFCCRGLDQKWLVLCC